MIDWSGMHNMEWWIRVEELQVIYSHNVLSLKSKDV